MVNITGSATIEEHVSAAAYADSLYLKMKSWGMIRSLRSQTHLTFSLIIPPIISIMKFKHHNTQKILRAFPQPCTGFSFSAQVGTLQNSPQKNAVQITNTA